MSDTPRYQSIYRHLLDGILSGAFGNGAYLPTEKELCQQFAVSRITAKHALDLLAREGLIRRIKGKGSVVLYNGEEPVKDDLPRPENLVGVIFSDFNEAYGIKVLYGIEEECRKSGLYPVLRLSHGNIEAEQDAIDELLTLGVSGLIIMPVNSEYYNPGILHLLLGDFPVIILDRQMKGLNACFVGTDNNAGTQLAMDHLFSLGHRTIAWVSSPAVQMSTLEERENAFQNTVMESGIVVNRELWFQDITARASNSRDNIEADLNRLADHLLAHRDITAIFASEYIVARFAKRAAQLIGCRIPEDLSIVCFDSPDSWYGESEFTYLRQQERRIGTEAVNLLRTRMRDGADTVPDSVMLPAELVVGRSTGRARAKGVLAK